MRITLNPFPDKKYEIIYADPPWNYKDKSKSHGGGAESHYNCMTIQEIISLPVNEISAENSILFLWVTFPQMKEGLLTIEEWGFIYKTVGFVWIKKNKKKGNLFWGMGRWTRSNAEVCLIGTKGKPKRQSASVHSVIEYPIEKHSKKPDIVRDKIIELCGDKPRIELFARDNPEDWDVWGNEVEINVS